MYPLIYILKKHIFKISRKTYIISGTLFPFIDLKSGNILYGNENDWHWFCFQNRRKLSGPSALEHLQELFRLHVKEKRKEMSFRRWIGFYFWPQSIPKLSFCWLNLNTYFNHSWKCNYSVAGSIVHIFSSRVFEQTEEAKTNTFCLNQGKLWSTVYFTVVPNSTRQCSSLIKIILKSCNIDQPKGCLLRATSILTHCQCSSKKSQLSINIRSLNYLLHNAEPGL